MNTTLERNQWSLNEADIHDEIEKHRKAVPALSRVDEVWFVETVFCDTAAPDGSRGYMGLKRYAGGKRLENLEFNHGKLFARSKNGVPLPRTITRCVEALSPERRGPLARLRTGVPFPSMRPFIRPIVDCGMLSVAREVDIMRTRPVPRSVSIVCVAVCVAFFASAEMRAQGRRNALPTDLPGLSAEVAKVEGFLPNQSHVMADLSYQFSNLWFAGLKKNWPLAQFFYNESRGRVRWMIRINPVVQDPDKKDVDLLGIFDAIDKDVWSLIKVAIDEKDVVKFQAAYKLGLEKGCYSCHKSVGRPYLRPQIPTQMPQTIITFDPNAKWPE